MAYPVILSLAAGAIGTYGAVTGRFDNMFENFKNKKNSSSSSSSASNRSNEQNHASQPTIVLAPSQSNRSNSYFLPFGCACVVALGGYYYYIHAAGTQQVIGKVEETAEETQELVQETDDNNAKRFDILDKKNEDRAQNLEIEMRTEQRAGFNVISEQIYCLQQVAIQTLNAVAMSMNKPSSAAHHDDDAECNAMSNEKLLGYCDKAQEMADTMISDQHTLTIRERNLKDIKAEVQLRSNGSRNVVHSGGDNHITPGGPGDIGDVDDCGDEAGAVKNPFDFRRNQRMVSTSYTPGGESQQQPSLDAMQTIAAFVEQLKHGVQPVQIACYVW
eukprot:CAMPEP_0202731064 /NCGR_PEP_ID=MMETSP1385-20130828/186956_1 /ASSEMBLY_ACC=CAM_ASM_000861 /TAXON_ID=933848 /ORGANISM="Elphidium margaritaceum" /LENGTH=330 /DNA_ID=CAMNT_0049397347 /DNA_START=28 /DNA_END=1017 /DNA_ORIENTATION=-